VDPFVAEIRIFPFNFAPKGWAWCDGQLLPISQNTALFSLLGTTYGGDGKSNFALPNLQGSAPMHPGQGPGLPLHDLGEPGGTAAALAAAPRLAFPWVAAAASRYVSYAGSLYRAGGAGKIETSADRGRTWTLHSDLGDLYSTENLAVDSRNSRLDLSVGYAGR